MRMKNRPIQQRKMRNGNVASASEGFVTQEFLSDKLDDYYLKSFLNEALLGSNEVNGLRYYVEISSLSASIDNVKSVLEKYATAPYVNLQGVSIVNIRFATAGQALSILSHYQSGSFAALVYGFSYSYVPPYYLNYSNGVWTDFLLASGSVIASSTLITTSVPNNTWKSIRSVDVTKGLWDFQYMAQFRAITNVGARAMSITSGIDSAGTYYGGIFVPAAPSVETVIRNRFIMNIANPKTIYLNVEQTSGSEMSVSGELLAYRLS